MNVHLTLIPATRRHRKAWFTKLDRGQARQYRKTTLKKKTYSKEESRKRRTEGRRQERRKEGRTYREKERKRKKDRQKEKFYYKILGQIFLFLCINNDKLLIYILLYDIL